MGDTTEISWSGATWNPWQGCRHASEGCRHCYMFRDKIRYGQDPTDIHRSSDATVRKPLKWQKEAASGKRTAEARMVFTCSWSDWFIEEADAWRDEGWEIIRQCPDLIFQILTKRAHRMADHLPAFWDEIRDRCWLGVSAEDQKNYDKRRPFVDANLAPVMWWSLEPLLGPIHIGLASYTHKPAWIVAGGESGSEARPMHPNWVDNLRSDCEGSGIAFHFKQWGEWVPATQIPRHDERQKARGAYIDYEGRTYREDGPVPPSTYRVVRVGKQAAGRLLFGRTWDEFPADAGLAVTP